MRVKITIVYTRNHKPPSQKNTHLTLSRLGYTFFLRLIPWGGPVPLNGLHTPRSGPDVYVCPSQ